MYTYKCDDSKVLLSTILKPIYPFGSLDRVAGFLVTFKIILNYSQVDKSRELDAKKPPVVIKI